ncbi:hypothetical protein EYF80_010735 [Liparis tanakae]|uniref:Uncharacterized protein n=1 Tax=Liparis tanakae TaxID=230148 RepID=A0A4Z2IMD0_9TELE|nr:hypothetical protein EYF80_010735 [Liparis tanakae]
MYPALWETSNPQTMFNTHPADLNRSLASVSGPTRRGLAMAVTQSTYRGPIGLGTVLTLMHAERTISPFGPPVYAQETTREMQCSSYTTHLIVNQHVPGGLQRIQNYKVRAFLANLLEGLSICSLLSIKRYIGEDYVPQLYGTKISPLSLRVQHPSVGHVDVQGVPLFQPDPSALLGAVHVIGRDVPAHGAARLHQHHGLAVLFDALVVDVLDELGVAHVHRGQPGRTAFLRAKGCGGEASRIRTALSHPRVPTLLEADDAAVLGLSRAVLLGQDGAYTLTGKTWFPSK